MKRQRLTVLFVLVGLVLTGLLPASASGPAQVLPVATSNNLIVNGDAEAGAGSIDGYTVVPVPGWVTQGNFTVVPYAVGGAFLSSNSPGPTNRGLNYFAGGPDEDLSSATQTIDLSGYATAINTGKQTFTLSGYLGGWDGQGDNATLTVNFKNAANLSLGTAVIGPVTNDERGNVNALLYRRINGLVPANSTQVDVTLKMTRLQGSYDDGYADNLFLGLGSASGGVISGKVYNDSAAAGNEVAGAFIQACLTGGGCEMTTSNSDGGYWFIDRLPGNIKSSLFRRVAIIAWLDCSAR
jgi:hypothetical protein